MKIKQQTNCLDKETTQKLYNIYRLATSVLDNEKEALWELIKESVQEHEIYMHPPVKLSPIPINHSNSMSISYKELEQYDSYYSYTINPGIVKYASSYSNANSYSYHYDTSTDFPKLKDVVKKTNNNGLSGLKPAVDANTIGIAKSLLDKNDINSLVKSKKLVKKVENHTGKPYVKKVKMKDKFKDSYIPISKKLLKEFKK
jgi:hypothetical protein